MSTIETIEDHQFEQTVLRSERPVLVEIGAAWCPPCRALEPVVEALAAELGDRLRVVALDADRAPETAAALGVRSVPTVVLIKAGREVARQVGAVPRARLLALLEGHL